MCNIANLFATNIIKFDDKKHPPPPLNAWTMWIIRKNYFLEEQNLWHTLCRTLAENQKHQISGSQNYWFLIKEVCNNFFDQWILFSNVGKAKKTLKTFCPPITKPFLKNLIPPLYEGRGGRGEGEGFGLWHSVLSLLESQWKLRQQRDQNFPMEGKPL